MIIHVEMGTKINFRTIVTGIKAAARKELITNKESKVRKVIKQNGQAS